MKNIKKDVAIVLGGTNPHKALIIELKNRGFHVILIDYLDDPPAREYADEHIQESTLDKEKVLEIARELRPKLIICTCIDRAIVTACYVSEILNLPIPYSYKTAQNITNKKLMKEMLVSGGIPTAKYIVTDNLNHALKSNLKYPLIIKPVDSEGSLGVAKIKNYDDLNKYFDYSCSHSKTGTVILEESYTGIEVQVDYYIKNSEPKLLMIREKNKNINYSENSIISCGSTIPVQITNTALTNINKIINNIVKVFKFKNTSLLIQAFIDNDSVNVIEIAARVGGQLSYKIIKDITGFDVISATVDSYLGIESAYDHWSPKKYFMSIILYATEGQFSHIDNTELLINEGFIKEVFVYKKKSSKIDSGITSRNRVGAVLIEGSDKTELYAKAKKVINLIDIKDMNNNSIKVNDLYNYL